MARWLASRLKGDHTIWAVVFLLSFFSILAVYSSTGTLAYRFHAGNTEYYLLKHTLLIMASLLTMYIAHRVPYWRYSRLGQVLLYLSVPLLILTIFSGTDVNQAKRWLTVPGIDVSFQTSDLAKLALLMYIARMLAHRQERIQSIKAAFLPIMGWVIGICGLIAPADLSTAVVIFSASLLLMFIGRVRIAHILLLVLSGIFVLSLYVSTVSFTGQPSRLPTWFARIEGFLEDDVGSYQNQQAKIAIAKGGFWPNGPGQSTQRNFLPNPYADFIFAIIVEEYGLLGGALLVFVYLLLLYRCTRIVLRCPKSFGALLAVGLSCSLVLQAFINMGVATHIFPVTGLTLPLVSMGGTSLLFTSLSLGIILSVSRYSEGDMEATEKEAESVRANRPKPTH
jgi:cell division protein FtsW